MKIEPKKQEVVVGLKIDTGLSPQELSEAQIQLPSLGPTGLAALRVMRALGAAASDLDAAVSSLVLVVNGISDPESCFKAEIQLDFKFKDKPSQANELLDLPLVNLAGKGGFCVRCMKCFGKLGLETIGDLIAKTADELFEMKNFAHSSLRIVREVLAKKGLHLKGEELP